MPPILALILCIVFVVFLLWLERKRSPEVTRVLWIPTIWMLYASSKPLGIWFPSSGADPVLGSPLDRAFLIVLIFLSLLLLIRRRFDWIIAIKENKWLIVLFVFMLVSILWSNIPYISFKRWTRELLAILMAFVVLSEPSPRKAIESILRRSTYILIPFSLLLIKYFPKYGVEYGRWTGGRMWTGVTLQKNSLGRLCLIASFFLIWSLVRRWQGHIILVWKYQTHAEIVVLAMAFRLMAGPRGEIFYAATAVGALIVGLFFYLGLYLIKKYGKNIRAGILMTMVSSIVIFGIVSLFTGGATVGSFAQSMGRDATLTDRTAIWASLLPAAMQRPITGSGFGSFWTSKTAEAFHFGEAHSGYLDELLGLGFVGILLVTAFLLSACRKAQRELARDFDWGAIWICYIIMAVVHNIAESSIDTFTSQLTAIVLFLSVSSKNSLSRN